MQRIYRFHRERDKLVRKQPAALVAIVQYSLQACLHTDSAVRESAVSLTSNPRYLQLFKAVLLHHAPAVRNLGQFFGVSSLRDQVDKLLSRLPGLGCHDGMSCSHDSLIDGLTIS